MTHNELNAIACKWLKRSFSAKGPGCQFSVTEVGGIHAGEIADAFGYRWGFMSGSVVVETKVSRPDFLADAKKAHRNGGVLGMGNFRYYICPEELIEIDELPYKWGLLWVNSRGHVKVKAGHALLLQKSQDREFIDDWRFPSNKDLELELMAHLLGRVGNAEEINTKFRELSSALSRANKKIDSLQRGESAIAFRRRLNKEASESLSDLKDGKA